MSVLVILPNVIAMLSSLAAMIVLSVVMFKMTGGSFSAMFKLLILGIFFAVFAHAAFELAEIFGLLSENILMPIMGVLITVGSIFFVVAGIVGLKALK